MSDVPNDFVLENLVGVTHASHVMLPISHHDHDVIGRYHISGTGAIYYCDSYDPRCGFWMTPAREGDTTWGSRTAERTNISERAIGRSYYRIWRDPYFPAAGGGWRVHCHTALINASIKGFEFEDDAELIAA